MDKGRHSKKEDNFWFKFLVAVIVILWISLVLGNYLGYLFVKSEWFIKAKGEKLKTASYPADEFIYSTPENSKDNSNSQTPKEISVSPSFLPKDEDLKEKPPIDKNKELPKETKKQNYFMLQVGVFSNKNNSENLIKELKNKDYQAFIKEEDGKFKVFIGNFNTKEEALKIQEELKQNGFTPLVKETNGISP